MSIFYLLYLRLNDLEDIFEGIAILKQMNKGLQYRHTMSTIERLADSNAAIFTFRLEHAEAPSLFTNVTFECPEKG